MRLGLHTARPSAPSRLLPTHTSALERRADQALGRRTAAHQNSMGAASPLTPPMTIAHSGRAEGGYRSEGAPGGAVHGPPLIPPPPGRPQDTDRTRTPGESALTTRGGPGFGTAGRPPEGEQGGRDATPPPHPLHRPASRGGAGPHPPRQGGWSPLPPPERGAGARPAPPPQPPAPTGTAESKQARADAPGRRTDRAQRRQASTTRSGMGTTPPVTRTTPVTPALLPAQGRQRDGTRQSDPPPYWPPRPHKRGARRTGRPPPQTRPPAHEHHGPAPRGAHSPKPGRGEPSTGPPPPPSTPDGARDWGRTRGGARTTWNGPTSAQCRDRARCARHTTQGRGEPTPQERERTHTQRARGDYQKGNRTELAERTDRVECRTSERG